MTFAAPRGRGDAGAAAAPATRAGDRGGLGHRPGDRHPAARRGRPRRTPAANCCAAHRCRPDAALARQGALVAAADVDGDAVSLLAAELGPDVLPLTADVSSEAQVADMAAAVRREFGGLDGLVNSARPSLPPRL